MIKKPKKLSVKFIIFVLIALLVPLTGFFVYAANNHQQLFKGLAFALGVISLSLIYIRNRLVQNQSTLDIKQQDSLEKSNLLEAELAKEDETIDSFRDKIDDIFQLKNLTEKLSMCLSLEDTSATLSKEVAKFFKDKNTTIILYLFHPQTGELGISASLKGQHKANIRSKKGDAYDQYVLKNLQPLIIEDTKRDFRFDHERILNEDSREIRSLMSVPLVVENKTLGILRLDNPKPGYFKVEELRLLIAIGDLGAITVENAQLYERIEELAIKDSLTGLYLRRFLVERMGQEISRVLRREKELSFLILDLDRFKKYNDKYGHMAGDIVLRTVGMLLLNHFISPGDIICRYGGEEFAVLLPDCSKKHAIQLAEEFRKKLETHTIILRREKTKVTVSIGVASFPKDAKLKDELIHKADNFLYKAKKEGRNKVCSR